MKNVREVLISARELIARGWVQGTFAIVRREGCDSWPVAWSDSRATHFCILGAIYRAAGCEESKLAERACRLAARTLPHYMSLPTFNDFQATKLEHVLALLDGAIARLEVKRLISAASEYRIPLALPAPVVLAEPPRGDPREVRYPAWVAPVPLCI